MSSLGLLKPQARLQRSALLGQRPAAWIQNGTAERLTMAKGRNTCLVEVVAKRDEDPSLAISRFAREVRNMNVAYEVRRRQQFENKQDKIKRKRKERGIKKRQAKFPVVTYAQKQITGLANAPFQEIFEDKAEDADPLFGDVGLWRCCLEDTTPERRVRRGGCRYPKCVVLCDEETPVEVDGVAIPVDYTKDSPNGHVDNLYLDMNGIIHPCFHPDDGVAPITFEECFKAIFAYIDRIMAIVRPRKLLYMAIDGVAPRAKMNQQRSRRFKTAKESKDKVRTAPLQGKAKAVWQMAEEKRIRADLKAQGLKVREGLVPTETTALSDSNIITPGTEFMAKLSVALQYYIHERINHRPAWRPLAVMLSDASVPGEGEHKIMEYIREQRGRPGWNPNLVHVVSGLDADLIHLALATHEPQFHILREVVFGAPAGDDPEGGAKPKIPYQYLKISILRDYLALEFNEVRLPFRFDKERVYDDFVFLCFFVGNDFLPHSPTLEIREGGIDLLMTIYKRQLPFLGGYLCHGAKVNLKRVEVIIREVSRCEEQILQKRMRIIKNQEAKRKSAVKRPMSVTVTPPPRVAVTPPEPYPKGTPKKQRTDEEDSQPSVEHSSPLSALEGCSVTGSSSIMDCVDEGGTSVDAQKVWRDLMSISPEQKAEYILPVESESEASMPEAEVEEMVQNQLKNVTSEKADMFDSMVQHGESVGFGTRGWKDRYYRMKFPDVPERERRQLVRDMAEKFVEGLLWVMAYYYEGVASWTWFYPYHYAPFASDLSDVARLNPEFELGEPFLPVNQLMAVLPAASRFCLPKCLQHLFVEKDSPILDFYPEDFKCDMNGKRFSWQAVVLLPFIDAKRLTDTTKEYFSEFTDEEKERNKRKLTQIYIGEHHPLSPFIKEALSGNESSPVVKVKLEPEQSDGMNGFLCIAGEYCPKTISAPFEVGEDIDHNSVSMGSFLNPPHQTHLSQLMEGAQEEASGVTVYDIPPEQQMWHEHPRAGNNTPHRSPGPRPQFAIDRDAAHRMVVHQVSAPRFKEDAPARRPAVTSKLSASAPEFVPEFVTRMALQMTGQLGYPQPPSVPPDAVTNAAIRLSERVRQTPMPGAMFPTFQHQGFQMQQPPQMMAQAPGGFQSLLPSPGGFQGLAPPMPMNLGLQPQIHAPPGFDQQHQFFAPGTSFQTPPPAPPRSDPSRNFRPPPPRRSSGSADSKSQRKRKK